MTEKYDVIGKTYNQTRKADKRILDAIMRLMNCRLPARILDLGAGTGNYSFEMAATGYEVFALEPSIVMLEQRKKHDRLSWFKGVAEKIPFDNGFFDRTVCILSSHHFHDLAMSLGEIKRVLKSGGQLLIFTQDPRLCPSGFWFKDYFPTIIEESYVMHPPMDEFRKQVEKIFKSKIEYSSFALPYDLEDGFFYSAWRYPGEYLDLEFCQGISSLAQFPKDLLKNYLLRLETDLKNGTWESKYGKLLEKDEFDCGYFFLLAKRL